MNKLRGVKLFTTENETLLKSLIEHALNDTRGVKRWHITRMSMYLALHDMLAKHDSGEKKCLCISQSQALADVTGIKQAERTITKYPDENLLHLSYKDNSYDFVFSDQVLEHIEGDPFQAVRESVRVAKPGAWIIHTTCFINFMHQLPLDFWRFTPQSLKLLLESAGAEVTTVGGWGNRLAWTYMQLGYRDRKVPEAPGNPIYELAKVNEKKWPIHVWVVAHKPLAA